jgi:hypothetical protein
MAIETHQSSVPTVRGIQHTRLYHLASTMHSASTVNTTAGTSASYPMCAVACEERRYQVGEWCCIVGSAL